MPIERTAEQERAAIVAWLRGRQRAHETAFKKAYALGKDHPHVDRFAVSSMAIEETADAIERGDHHSGETNNG